MEENNHKERENRTPSKMARLAWPKAKYGVIIAIIIAILANVFASYSFHPSNQYTTEISTSQQTRTAPEGKINLASNPTIKQEVVAIVASSGPISGKDIYNNVCMSCHTSGAAGATGRSE